jgi:hypothetical protein
MKKIEKKIDIEKGKDIKILIEKEIIINTMIKIIKESKFKNINRNKKEEGKIC